MFNLAGEKANAAKQRYKIGKRLKIETANALLADKRYKYYIEQVQSYAGLPAEHFDSFYKVAIHRFAEFVQHLPETPNEFLTSMLVNGLLRGINTLHIFVTEYDNPSPLERFALFTAAILQEISRVVTQQKIFITDFEGATIKVWQPFCGPLTEEVEGAHYKIIPLSSYYQQMNKSIKMTLARQVLGESGFLWIASDLRLFIEWLEALINEEGEGGKRLKYILQRYRRFGGGVLDTLPLIDIELLESPATQYGDEFYNWLIEGLEDGSIEMNTADADVHMTELGLFIETPGIFKRFCELHENLPVNQFIVFTQFGNLIGIASKGGNDYLHTQLFSDYPSAEHKSGFANPLSTKSHSMKDGILIRDPNTILLNGKQPDATPHIKASNLLKKSFGQIEQYNLSTKPNLTMKNH